MFTRLAIVILLSSFYLAFQGCSLIEPPPQDLVARGEVTTLHSQNTTGNRLVNFE